MGAGTETDHYCQDASEIDLPLSIKKELKKLGAKIEDGSIERSQINFDEYLRDRGLDCDEYLNHKHWGKNCMKHAKNIAKDIYKSFPDKFIDLLCVETEYRGKGKKGDFIILVADHKIISYDDPSIDTISVSLKNQGSVDSMQCCSGTWVSFVLNMLYNRKGPGQFISPDGEIFRSTQIDDSVRGKALIKKINLSQQAVDLIKFLQKLNSENRDKYLEGEFGRFFNDEVKESWKNDCEQLGEKAINQIIPFLETINKTNLTKHILKMSGFQSDGEELLVLGRKKYLSSLNHTIYRDIIQKLNSDCVELTIEKHCKNIRFNFKNLDGDYLFPQGFCNIPFTLQKNGAWFKCSDSECFEGKQFHKKEKCELGWRERRPKKSREMNTSTNCYVNLKKLGIVPIV